MPTIEELAQQFGGVKIEQPNVLSKSQDITQIAQRFGGVPVQQPLEKPGFLKNLAQGVASPFLKTIATGASIFKEIPRSLKIGAGVADIGIKRLLGRDVEQEKEDLFKLGRKEPEAVTLDAGFLGKAKPLESFAESVGTGLEIGSFFIGGSGLSQIGKQTIKGLMLQGAKEGAKFGFIGGALGGGGLALQQEKITPEDFFKQTVGGAFIGGALGGVIGGVSPMIGNIFRRIRKIIKKEPVAPGITKRTLGRVIEKTEKKLGEIAEIKAQPINIKKAVDAGIDLPDAQFIDKLSLADKKSGIKMLDLLEKNRAGDVTARSISESGNTVLDSVKFVQKLRQSSGKKIGALVNNLPDQKLDISDVATSFIDDLTGSGVTINSKGKLNFANSRLAGRNAERQQIESMWQFLKPAKTGVVNKKPLQIHLQRQKLFDDLQLAKGQKLFSSNTERMLSKVRNNLNNPLDSVSSQYTKLNKQFAESTSAIDDFFRLIGRQWKGADKELLALRAGEVGRRIKGNASAVPLKVLGAIDDLARKSGFKSDKNIINQFLFNDLLEDLFGTTQTTGLAGSLERGLGRTEFGTSIVQQLARGRVLGATAQVLGKVADVFSPTEREQIRILKELLKGVTKTLGR